MIRTFKDKETQKLFMGRRSRAVSGQAVRRAQLKLAQLDQVESVEELKVPPGNRLQSASNGKRQALHFSPTNGEAREEHGIWAVRTG